MYKSLIQGESPRFAIILLLIVFLVILTFPFLFTRECSWCASFTETGQIGDTIGGITSPFIGIIGASLTFIAFWVQLRANKAQAKQFQAQDNDTKIDRFENKFFELINLHKSNVDEILIDGYNDRTIEKRKAFANMYKELYFIYVVSENFYKKHYNKNEIEKEKYSDILYISYVFFYAGIGEYSDNLTRSMISKDFDFDFYKDLKSELERWRRSISKNANNTVTFEDKEYQFKYKICSGHLHRLGHYYRHLYQTVKYVASQDSKFLDHDTKIQYLSMLRSQLSDYEQVLLYYNAIVGFGEKWIENEYFTTYRMIHNLPLPLAEFGISAKEYFRDNKDMFDWGE